MFLRPGHCSILLYCILCQAAISDWLRYYQYEIVSVRPDSFVVSRSDRPPPRGVQITNARMIQAVEFCVSHVFVKFCRYVLCHSFSPPSTCSCTPPILPIGLAQIVIAIDLLSYTRFPGKLRTKCFLTESCYKFWFQSLSPNSFRLHRVPLRILLLSLRMCTVQHLTDSEFANSTIPPPTALRFIWHGISFFNHKHPPRSE